MIKTIKAKLHFFDNSSGDGLAIIIHEGRTFFVPVYMVSKQRITLSETGDTAVLNVLYNAHPIDSSIETWIDIPELANINVNLTKLLKKAS